MANLPISGLTASATNLAAADVLPVVQTTGVGPVKMTGVQLGAGLLSATIPIGSGPFLTRRGAANVQLGAADAAAPVAQTLSVQSVVAGTTNTAGTNFTIAGSQGTGTGAGGSLIFQVAPAGSSGSAQNALATVMSIYASSALVLQNHSDTGAVLSAGSSFSRTLQIGGSTFGNNGFLAVRDYGIIVTRGHGYYCWENGGNNPGTGTIDLILARRAAASLQLGAADAAAPVAQTFGVQSVVAGTTNTAGTNFTIAGSQSTGTGAGGSLIFQVAPAGSSGSAQNALATALTINSAGTISANLSGFNVQNNASSPYLIEGTRLIGRSGATISLCDNAYWQTLAFHTNNAVSLALDATGSVRVAKALTVATLPGTPATGMIARVTDALTPVVGSTVTAGGSAQALVWYNGANWTVTGV